MTAVTVALLINICLNGSLLGSPIRYWILEVVTLKKFIQVIERGQEDRFSFSTMNSGSFIIE